MLLAFSTILLAACTSKSSTSTPTSAPVPASAPAAAKPAEPKPAEPKPAEPKPAAQPAESAKSEAKPAEPAGAVDPAIAAMRAFIDTQKVDKQKSGWKTKLALPPKLSFTPGRKYFWQLTTSEGPIKIRLMPDVAPMHVSSTIYLAELGFYDGLTFHRVVPEFMAQGGCPLGNGSGSPGYKYASEFSPNAKHDRPGLLSMANAGPGTDGSQFFLTFVPTPFLDGKHTVFGEIVEGMDTLKKLERFGTKPPPSKPTKPLGIQSTKIVVE